MNQPYIFLKSRRMKNPDFRNFLQTAEKYFKNVTEDAQKHIKVTLPASISQFIYVSLNYWRNEHKKLLQYLSVLRKLRLVFTFYIPLYLFDYEKAYKIFGTRDPHAIVLAITYSGDLYQASIGLRDEPFTNGYWLINLQGRDRIVFGDIPHESIPVKYLSFSQQLRRIIADTIKQIYGKNNGSYINVSYPENMYQYHVHLRDLFSRMKLPHAICEEHALMDTMKSVIQKTGILFRVLSEFDNGVIYGTINPDPIYVTRYTLRIYYYDYGMDVLNSLAERLFNLNEETLYMIHDAIVSIKSKWPTSLNIPLFVTRAELINTDSRSILLLRINKHKGKYKISTKLVSRVWHGHVLVWRVQKPYIVHVSNGRVNETYIIE